MRWNIRTIAVYRLLYWIPLFATLEHQLHRCVCAREKLLAARHGRCDVGRNACTAYGYIPDCRADWWLLDVYATDDCERGGLHDYQHLRAPQHLWFASGQARKTAHPPYRPCRADTDESRLGH